MTLLQKYIRFDQTCQVLKYKNDISAKYFIPVMNPLTLVSRGRVFAPQMTYRIAPASGMAMPESNQKRFQI